MKSCIIALLCVLSLKLSAAGFVASKRNVHKPFRSESFATCCSLGKEVSNSTAVNACMDFSSLKDKSSGCQFAFTICCNQKRRLLFLRNNFFRYNFFSSFLQFFYEIQSQTPKQYVQNDVTFRVQNFLNFIFFKKNRNFTLFFKLVENWINFNEILKKLKILSHHFVELDELILVFWRFEIRFLSIS